MLILGGLTVDISHAEENLAKQSRNPLETIISLPFENNLFFGIGTSDTASYGLTWKPVYPASLGNWVTGMLLQNAWSFAGDDDANDVNKFLFQYFINYNFADGWY